MVYSFYTFSQTYAPTIHLKMGHLAGVAVSSDVSLGDMQVKLVGKIVILG